MMHVAPDLLSHEAIQSPPLQIMEMLCLECKNLNL